MAEPVHFPSDGLVVTPPTFIQHLFIQQIVVEHLPYIRHILSTVSRIEKNSYLTELTDN